MKVDQAKRMAALEGDNSTLTKEGMAGFLTRILKPGEFLVRGRILKRAESSLCCKLKNTSKLRRAIVQTIESKYFDNTIMACIIFNSILMAMFDYAGDNKCAYDAKEESCPSD